MEIVHLLKRKVRKLKGLFAKPKAVLPFFTKDIFINSKFQIGDYTYGNPTVLFENNQSTLIIGKFCSIADNVTIFLGGNHRLDWISTYPFNVLPQYFPKAAGITGHPSTNGAVVIGHDVWIGRGVVIMSGVTIGNGAVLAAGSVVTKAVGAYEIWGGNPAKLIKKRFSEETIIALNALQWWDWDLELIKENVGILCSNNVEVLQEKKHSYR